MRENQVSIVIVCMNNLKNLYPCLNSIKRYTKVGYETFVVAYLFSPENLAKVKVDFPWVKFIESNEIRGFSENNNLALRQAQGKYCFVVNDDTEMQMPVIDELVKTIESLPEDVAIVSPVTTFPDGRIQVCGRPYKDWRHIVLQDLHLWKESTQKKYVNKEGIFKTYNIIGAAFLIKTKVFEKLGWFDEKFFFCPEDIALSTKANQSGFFCYVNSDVKIVHYEGMSGKSLSMVQTATRPAAMRGALMFYGNKWYSLLLLRIVFLVLFSLKYVVHGIRSLTEKKPNIQEILAIGDRHCLRYCFSSASPKEIFSRYFLAMKKKKSMDEKK